MRNTQEFNIEDCAFISPDLIEHCSKHGLNSLASYVKEREDYYKDKLTRKKSAD